MPPCWNCNADVALGLFSGRRYNTVIDAHAGEVQVLRAVQKLFCQLKVNLAAAAGMITLDDAKLALQQFLRGRHLLVVVDDVWDPCIPGLFQAADCQLLVTAQQLNMGLSDCQAVNLTPQMIHDSGVAPAILDAHNIDSRELVSMYCC